MKNIKRKLALLSILMMLCVVMLYSQTIAMPPANFGEEDAGTETNPYLIANLANLRWVSECWQDWDAGDVAVYFLQTADIDATETAQWNDGTGFRPIGYEGPHIAVDGAYPGPIFKGVYDGGNFTISNLFSRGFPINPNYKPIGLFWHIIEDSEIKNVHLRDVDFYSYMTLYRAGTLAMVTHSSVITNCSITGDITAGPDVGGLIANAINTSIENCAVIVNVTQIPGVTTDIRPFGGIVNTLYNSTLSNSYFNGTWSGQIQNNNLHIHGPFGGLVGRISGESSISNCYATYTTGFDIIPDNWSPYMTNGIIGYSYPNAEFSIQNCFWDMERTEATVPITGATGLTTAQMKQASTFINAGWDFDNVWAIDPEINDGYPYLRDNPFEPEIDEPIVITEFPFTDTFGQNGSGAEPPEGWLNLGGWVFSGQNQWAEALETTDLLITPALQLPVTSADEEMYLNFWAGNRLPLINLDIQLDVYLSTTGTEPADFDTYLDNFSLVHGFRHNAISLTQWEGQIVYIAFMMNVNGALTPGDVNRTHAILSDVWIGASANPGVMVNDDNPMLAVPVMDVYVEDDGNWYLSFDYIALSAETSDYEVRISFDDLNYTTVSEATICHENGWIYTHLPLSGHTLAATGKVKIVLVKVGGNSFWVSTTRSRWVNGPSVEIEDEPMPVMTTQLGQNYPNPFNPSTTIEFGIWNSEIGLRNVTLDIFNIKGQKVRSLVNDILPAGSHSVVWNGTDDSGNPVGSGIYFYRLKTDDFIQTKKMILMK